MVIEIMEARVYIGEFSERLVGVSRSALIPRLAACCRHLWLSTLEEDYPKELADWDIVNEFFGSAPDSLLEWESFAVDVDDGVSESATLLGQRLGGLNGEALKRLMSMVEATADRVVARLRGRGASAQLDFLLRNEWNEEEIVKSLKGADHGEK